MKRYVWIIIIISFLANCASTASIEYDNADDFRIEPLNDGKSAKIIRYAGTSQVIRIPPVIHGLSIVEIGEEVFVTKN